MNSCEKKEFDRIVEYIKQGENKIIIFGAGSYGKMVYRMLKDKGVVNKLIAFCDNDRQKYGDSIYGLEVLGYEAAKRDYPNCIFVIASTYYTEIENQLKKLCEKNYYTICPRHIAEYNDEVMHQGRIWMAKEWAKINKVDFKYNMNKLEELLADQESKDVLNNIVNFRNTGDYSYIENIYNPYVLQYFDNSIIELRDDEFFIDLGAWEGDTICNFIKASNNKYKRIVSFEPGEQQFKALNQMIRNKNLINIDTYKIGAWSETGYLFFEEDGGGSSRIYDKGATKIKVDAMDNMFLDEPVSFIKMDVEGAEEQALLGAKNIIQKYKPKLAICVYHKPEDIVGLPLLIKEILPEYKIYLRHHTGFDIETVCYAYI